MNGGSEEISELIAKFIGAIGSVSTFQRKTDINPVFRPLTPGMFQHSVRMDKDGPLFTPATFSGPRKNASFVIASGICLDFDKGHPTPDDIFAAFPGQLVWLYSTFNHLPESPRYRAVLPLSRAVEAAEHVPLAKVILEVLPAGLTACLDPCCLERGRIHYLPSCPPGSREYALSKIQDGILLDVDSLFLIGRELPPTVEEIKRGTRADSKGTRPGDDFIRRHQIEEVLETLGWKHVRGDYWLRPDCDTDSDHSGKVFQRGVYVYSSSAPVPIGYHDGFSLFTHSRFNGDFAAAARYLAAEGYGENSFVQIAATESEILTEPDCPGEAKPGWPVLSSAALPGILGEFVEVACRNSEADPAAVAATFLVRFGIEAGASSFVAVGETRHYARLSAVIVGESSKARKGTSAGPIKTVFSGLPNGCATSPGPLSSGEGIIYAVRDEERTWVIDRKSGFGQYQVSDPGIEDKRLFILDEEFANALNATRREGNTLSGIIRGLYDDGSAAPLTKHNRTKTTGAHVGIVSHVTVAELKAKLAETEQLNGFGNRFLWVCARRQRLVPFPEPIPDQERRMICTLIQERLEHAFRGGEYQLSPEARELWAAEYPKLSMAHKGLAGCMVNRGEAQVMRLALIYALLSLHIKIERDDIEAALAFWSYCEDSALHLFGGELGDIRKRKILTALNAQPRMTRNEIREQVFQKHLSAEGLTTVLEEMEEESLVETLVEKTDGAPRQIVMLKESARKAR
ncbi:YfjI family protein [Geomesophilobacter sediminis]|uniref:DUF3987 domain-containing protein n=1 Tax=Geomesophilobacter sediminis TaxID=2798584 RepID=A0A8J7JDM5_9BACT|nr:DUF3987 domain-containing protein [Geomesophilobacter sediminis]MBJ6725406.1 DUF3987 domain-containing protein [Geomesophilobacter sediminis]